jgi:hypothetical protein
MGATIFVLPDDIVEVQPKMVSLGLNQMLTFIGTLMALSKAML